MSGQADVEPRVYLAGLALRPTEVEAVVFDLPGCQCVGRDRAAVLALLPVVIAEHLAWLDQHSDVTRHAFPFEVQVAEKVEVASLADIADGEFCFEDDRRPETRAAVETAMRLMAYARRDLLAAVRWLPDLVLDWEPPASAVRGDVWAPEARTIRGILKHVANADGYYAGNLDLVLRPPGSVTDRNDLFGQRERAIARLRALTDEELRSECKHRRPWQTEGYEHWTVRKALRRFIAHERFHTKEIEQRLAWLLLGAPELSRVAAASA